MKFSKIEFTVGCFIVAAIICGVLLALKVAGLTFDFKTDCYTVHGYFDNVGSLTGHIEEPGSEFFLVGSARR